MKLRILFLFILVLINSNLLSAQESVSKIKVTGYITDTNNKPIQDIIIMIDNEKQNTFINKKGFYQIKVPAKTKSIIAFSLKYGLKEHIYKGETEVNFQFQANDNLHITEHQDGQKINVGYGAVDKEELSSSVSVIEGNSSNHYRNIYDMIAGKVPGVTVTGTKIVIRGLSSFNSGTDPLFVVDGQVVQNINDIPPSEVDNISILKGGEAAMYGSRGGNGVILITMKKAKRGN